MNDIKSMDDLSDLLSPQAVQAALVAPNKKSLFQQLAVVAARFVDADPKMIVERLTDRERLGSTGWRWCCDSPWQDRRTRSSRGYIRPLGRTDRFRGDRRSSG
jgi:hypothetical protein